MARIIHVDTATEWRGGQKQLLLLVKGMISRGHSAVVACPEKGKLWSVLVDLNVERIAIPAGLSLRTPFILRKSKADLLAAHTSHAHSCCMFLSTPLVVHRRVDFIPSGGFKYRRPQAYVAVSNAVAKILKGVGALNVHVVHDGVAALKEMAPAPDGPEVLAVGALVPHKGHHILSEAAKMLPNVDIGVAGEGPLKYPGIRYLGFRKDVSALFSSARIFVHPSVEEGMGQVVVEAMLSGLPVVVSSAGGLPEVVGESGIIVPPNDASALAEGIASALKGEHPEPSLAQRRAEDLFHVDGMVEKTLTVYSEVLSMTT